MDAPRDYIDVPAFERWCAGHRIEIDERLQITASFDNGISICTKPDVNIEIGESVARIPKSMVFSTSNCSKACELAPWLTGSEPTFELALALITEEQLAARSPWHGYFLLLPQRVVNIGVFWHLYGNRDGLEARQWLRGTEAEKILSQPKGAQTLIERIDAYFETIAKSILQSKFGITSCLSDFHRACSIVSSRAFLVDAHLGLSLVPVADLFNHTESNHVHLETDYHVCSVCGSLQECGHDNEDYVDWQPIELTVVDDTCEMVANLPIGGSEEVFNTYEDSLTNAHLLCYYGFMVDGNENEAITWTIGELLNSSGEDAAETQSEDGPLSTHWKLLASRLLNHWKGSQMVYNPFSKQNEGGTAAIEEHRHGEAGTSIPGSLLNPISGCLNLNADGQVSLQLWVALFLLALADVKCKFDIGIKDAIEFIDIIAKQQEHFEGLMTTDGEHAAADPGSSSKVNEGNCMIFEHRALQFEAITNSIDINKIIIVRKIAELVVHICGRKLQSVHVPDLSEQQIGEMLDDIPEEEKRLVRLGMKYALEIRRILRSCQSAWIELAEFITTLPTWKEATMTRT